MVSKTRSDGEKKTSSIRMPVGLMCVYIFGRLSIHGMDSTGVGIFVVGLFLLCLCTFEAIWSKKVADRRREEGKDSGVHNAGWVIMSMLSAISIAGCLYQGCRLTQAGQPTREPISVPKQVHFAPQVQETFPQANPAEAAELTPEQRQHDLDYMKNLRLPEGATKMLRNAKPASGVSRQNKH